MTSGEACIKAFCWPIQQLDLTWLKAKVCLYWQSLCLKLLQHQQWQDMPRGQLHQHFRCQSRAAFAQIIFGAFKGNSICQMCAKILRSIQKLRPKTCSKILADMLVKQDSTFYIMLAPLQTVQTVASTISIVTNEIYNCSKRGLYYKMLPSQIIPLAA